MLLSFQIPRDDISSLAHLSNLATVDNNDQIGIGEEFHVMRAQNSSPIGEQALNALDEYMLGYMGVYRTQRVVEKKEILIGTWVTRSC